MKKKEKAKQERKENKERKAVEKIWKKFIKEEFFSWGQNLEVKREDWLEEPDDDMEKWKEYVEGKKLKGDEQENAEEKNSYWKRLKKSIHDRFSQIKWCFGLYIPLCIFLAFAGSLVIGVVTNYLQEFVISEYYYKNEVNYEYEVWIDKEGNSHYGYREWENNSGAFKTFYDFVSALQFFLIPIWILLSVYFTGKIFYHRQLKTPINLLLDASRRIADNQLDFHLEYDKPNEFGILCRAFDEMRSALYESNRELWRSLEERKRLNAAFSHDLRTPLTVLRGYADFLEKYLPSGNVSEEKLLEVLGMMSGQIIRLEHYAQKMNSVQKLGDIMPNPEPVIAGWLRDSFLRTGELICKKKEFKLVWQGEDPLYFDVELILQIYENLVSNAFRYADKSVLVQCAVENGMFHFVVTDDGKGFSEEALRCAMEPFFRDEREPDKMHFGLGLYICRILCEKCGGTLKIGNVLKEGAYGGRVIASVLCENDKRK